MKSTRPAGLMRRGGVPLDVAAKVRSAGVVGAGGAGFPTHVKLDAHPEFVIVNGAECEPLLRVDQLLGAAYAEELLDALERVRAAVGARRAIYGLKDKYHDTVDALRGVIARYPDIEIKTLRNTYPAGDEQVLVYETIGRVVPEGGIPLAVGAVVLNVETLLNIGLALRDIPVTEKYVTVAGAVRAPATIRFPIGVSVREAIDDCGGTDLEAYAVIDGGPMMGKTVAPDAPITKTTKGLLVVPEDHPWVSAKNRGIERMMRVAKIACCHCMLCTEVCPRYQLGHNLHPDKLMRLASYNTTAERDAAATEAFLCCECGLCELGCIMDLQPWKLNQELKRRLSALGIKNPHRNAPQTVRAFREHKLYPVPKLVRRIAMSRYDGPAPLRGGYDRVPERVVLPLRQSLGAPSVPCVAAGDLVRKGDPVADIPQGALGSRLHSSIDGRVAEVREDAVVVESGTK